MTDIQEIGKDSKLVYRPYLSLEIFEKWLKTCEINIFPKNNGKFELYQKYTGKAHENQNFYQKILKKIDIYLQRTKGK